jgi:hypothetical protein
MAVSLHTSVLSAVNASAQESGPHVCLSFVGSEQLGVRYVNIDALWEKARTTYFP